MKLIIGLLIFICVTVLTMYFAVTKRFDYKLTIIFLVFAIMAGFVVANYDVVKHLKFGHEGLEVETKAAKLEIASAKTSALAEINTEMKSQKDAIQLLISNANDTYDKLGDQEKSITELLNSGTALQERIEEQKAEVTMLNRDSQAAKKEIEKLNEASTRIALALFKATYLTLQTKYDFGGDRPKKAVTEIEKDLNQILPMVITDPQERKQWIQQLQETLPKR